MSNRYREPLPRLSIPPSLNLQQPMAFDLRQPMFSPALPTSLQHSLHPPFPSNNNPMQTPMQPFFAPHPPPPPGRPSHRNQSSIAQLPPVGLLPPNGIPMTPMGQGHFPHTSISLPGAPPFSQHFHPPRNRRQLSIGGPPKAALGGPGRKHSPLPPPSDTPHTTGQRTKKINVVLPRETIPGEDDKPATHPPWARVPLDPSLVPKGQVVIYPELSSCDSYPPDSWRYYEPTTIDVFLPGKIAWDTIKQQVIEEKLEKLGVERGSGTSMPHLHAPHARAASISSPADPNLLYFKLNRLQQTQTISSLSSVSSSPQPLFALSPSPHQPLPPRLQNRHGPSMSLAPPLSFQPSLSLPHANSFAPSATLDPDQALRRISPIPTLLPETSISSESIHAPQGRVPLTVPSLAPPQTLQPSSRSDFVRGFGLDIPEEEEAQELVGFGGLSKDEDMNPKLQRANDSENDEQEIEVNDAQDEESLLTASQSRFHSRQVSQLSAASSPPFVAGLTEEIQEEGDTVPLRDAIPVPEIDDLDQDAAAEWTGSEDLYMCGPDTSDDESIGEWSNPSDEERARNHRVERRMLRRVHKTEMPRRLPRFPRPPDNTGALPMRREVDIISNPSEEEHIAVVQPNGFHSSLPPHSIDSPRTLSHISHSRGLSGQLPARDPGQTHSRATSSHLEFPMTNQQQPSLSGRRNSLNPLAKPFVFGTSRESGSLSTGSVQAANVFSHSRFPSIGKPLNAAALEFKPGGFTFRPPPGVPHLTFPAPDTARPLPLPPIGSSSAMAHQGREKRQRRGSSGSSQDENCMDSYRFPNLSDVVSRSEPLATDTDLRQMSPHISNQPAMSENIPRSLPPVPQEAVPLSHSLIANNGSVDATLQDDTTTTRAEKNDPILPSEDPAVPSTVKVKRTPIPLDFKHPTSSNTIPAGVFKALVNAGDEKTRRSVRSRLSSRDIFEHVHRPSLDDSNVLPISRKISRSRLVTDPGSPEAPEVLDDIFGSNINRQSSLPSALHSRANSSSSHVSVPAVDLTGKFELQRYEQQLRNLLDEKIDVMRRDYRDSTRSQTMSPTTKSMITDVVSLFRAQLQESATRSLDDSQMDARGELDFELIKDLIQQGQAESQDLLRRELSKFVEHLAYIRATGGFTPDTKSLIEELNSRTARTLTTIISQLSDRLDSMNLSQPAFEPDEVVDKLMTMLTPVLTSLRSEPVDYEYLTGQLSQAVKPHISQLIDLASDKRETAGLIVDSLLPILQSFRPPASSFDADTLSGQLTAEIRRLIAPIDPFEIKEQVADLVVERLDSRLALRDRMFSAEAISGKVNEGIAPLLQPVQQANLVLETLLTGQETLSTQQEHLTSLHKDTARLLTDLSPKLATAIDAFHTQSSKVETSISSSEPSANINHIRSTLDDLADGQKSLSLRHEELGSFHKDIFDRLNVLPEAFTAATKALQAAHADFASSHETTKSELDELRKSNADYQTQLAKARTAHGQVRVEKDLLSEKLTDVEKDRDRLLAQVNEAHATATAKDEEALANHSRNSELEEALSQALAGLQASDVAAQTSQERIASLERLNHELASENQNLKPKVDLLESQVNNAARDKQALEQSFAALQNQYDTLLARQNHLVDFCHISEQMKALTTLIGQVDKDEVKDLERIRDRYNTLEGEHVALQKRFKDQESKLANSERAALVARQSLSQAQQRASEWESRAKDHESKLELTQTKLDQAEQTHAQLDADYSLATLQLEEREADYRLTKDRENQLREHVKSLEAKVARLQGELDHAKSAPPSFRYQLGPTNNGHARPDSRMSVTFDGRSVTPIVQANGRSSIPPSPPQGSVWDSMHAPGGRAVLTRGYPIQVPTTPKAHRPQSYFRPPIPSPTPSNVSLAPTQGEDGWWY